MHLVSLVILAGWVAFWIYWFAAARGIRAGRARWGSFAGVRVVFILLVLLLAHARVFKGHQAATNDPWLQALGLVLFVCGLALAVWARIYLGRNWGTPMSQRDDPELVTSGPYRRVRHPIYSGIILAMVGTAVAVSWYWFVAVGVLGAYFIYSATAEEHYMTKLFPDAYPAFKRSTKMLIPFVF
jgi:protein-S-isoprenylcysteine O-methyltransferase Ste14